jgi:cell wall-associated NlpC family hydrolase
MDKREFAIQVAMRFLGRPYIWGGDDPMKGFDCSGFVIEVLQSVDLFPPNDDTTAKGLFARFQNHRIHMPIRGALVFWERNNNQIQHVELCLSDTISIGASGGGSATQTVQDAIIQNAYIKIRSFEKRKFDARLHFVDPFAPPNPMFDSV